MRHRSPPCLDLAGNGPPPPTPPHTPFVPGKINNSEELGKGVLPEVEKRRGGHAPPTPAPGPCGKGEGVLRGGGVPAVAGEGRAQPGERRRTAGQSTEAGGPGLPRLQVRGRGQGSSRRAAEADGARGAQEGELYDRGGRGAGLGPGQGSGRRTARSLRRSGLYFAAETLLSADNGAGCLLRAGRQLAIHRERCVTQMSRGS